MQCELLETFQHAFTPSSGRGCRSGDEAAPGTHEGEFELSLRRRLDLEPKLRRKGKRRPRSEGRVS